MKGCLYSVAMPIGNADDLSRRASQVLQDCDIIACEDSRKLKSWLSRAGINSRAKFFSHHSHNAAASSKGILQQLEAGKTVALVTDAGTPQISDPGSELIKTGFQIGADVSPIPGPSALAAIVSVAPFSVSPFLFLGFLSPKSGRRKNILLKYQDFEGAIVLYESVHRVESLVTDIDELWPDIEMFIGREITKTHEEFFWGGAKKAIDWLSQKKGEFSLIINKRYRNT